VVGRLRSVPAPEVVALPASLRDAIVAHCLAEAPLEACGLVIGDRPWRDGGRALRWVPVANALAAPARFELDPGALLGLTLAADAAGECFWAIAHSHPASEARPSSTDVRAATHPESIHLVVSLADPAAPVVRAWAIEGGAARELPLEVR
jgi:proteasome lid subunit RPN8/RPN11